MEVIGFGGCRASGSLGSVEFSKDTSQMDSQVKYPSVVMYIQESLSTCIQLYCYSFALRPAWAGHKCSDGFDFSQL